MSKIMDRMVDLQAVDWTTVSAMTLDQWEHEALFHDMRCRCEKCAVFFARLTSGKSTDRRRAAAIDGCDTPACAIAREIILALRGILTQLGKL